MENELDLDNPINVPEEAPEAPQEDLTPKLKELEEKNKQLFERAKKAEEKLKEIKPLREEPREEPKVDDDFWKNKVEFVLANQEKKYTKDEIDHISFVAREKKLSLDEAANLEEPYIQFKREKVAQEKKVPEPGNVPGGLPKKEISVEDIAKDPDAHRKAFDKLFEPTQESGI